LKPICLTPQGEGDVTRQMAMFISADV